MKISIIGIGKLGLCLSLNLENSGYEVLGMDVSETYVKSLQDKTFNSSEPQVNELLRNSKNVKFSTNLEEALENDVIFIVVNTPSTSDWKYDHTNIDKVINNILSFGKKDRRKDLIINCTTFPGYCKSLNEKTNLYNYFISYNPEFIAQGTIVKDQLYCDSVLIGAYDSYAENLIEDIYKKMCKSSPIVNKVSPTEAELIKLAVNCFLTTKISYANMIGDIALKLGCDPKNVLSAVGSDSRIGNKYLKHGFGFGGPCFPRDNRALAKCAEEVGIDAVISKSTDIMNERHLDYQIEEFIKNNKDKSIPVNIDHVTYKAGTVILEESQQLKFSIKLAEIGYSVIINDSKEVIEQLKKLYGNKFTYNIK